MSYFNLFYNDVRFVYFQWSVSCCYGIEEEHAIVFDYALHTLLGIGKAFPWWLRYVVSMPWRQVAALWLGRNLSSLYLKIHVCGFALVLPCYEFDRPTDSKCSSSGDGYQNASLFQLILLCFSVQLYGYLHEILCFLLSFKNPFIHIVVCTSYLLRWFHDPEHVKDGRSLP